MESIPTPLLSRIESVMFMQKENSFFVHEEYLFLRLLSLFLSAGKFLKKWSGELWGDVVR